MKFCMKYDHNIAGNTRVILLIADKTDIQTETHFHEHVDLLQAFFFFNIIQIKFWNLKVENGLEK